ncbi:MAG: glycosyltransferase [Acidobacteriota bacterium]
MSNHESPLRLAFVMPGIGVYERGAEIFVVELAEALVGRHGFEVELYCRGPVGLPHHRIDAFSRDTRWWNALYSATRLGRKALDTLYLDPLNLEWDTAALASLPGLWRGGYDAVVMEGGLVGAWGCRLLRLAKGTPFVDIAHGNSPKWEGAFARQRPDRAVVFTAAAAEMVRERAPRAHIEIIPHGVDLERFTPSGPSVSTGTPVELALQSPIFLTAGSVDPHKRMELAVEAVARLGRGSLVVLGDGESAAALDALAVRRLGSGRYLRRRVPRHEIAAWYRAADVFTLPSLTESFGLVYLEAMACGRPCVATADTVRREVLGDGGLCCDPAALDDYTATLVRALETAWGDRPRRQAERYPFTATVDDYAAMFRQLIAEQRRALR